MNRSSRIKPATADSCEFVLFGTRQYDVASSEYTYTAGCSCWLQTAPLLNVKKRKVSFNFQKNSCHNKFIEIIFIIQTFITVFDQVSAQPPTAVKKFLRKTCPLTLLDCLRLGRSKTSCPSADPLLKILAFLCTPID